MSSTMFTILVSLLAMIAMLGFVSLGILIDTITRGKLTSFFIKLFSGGRDE